MKPNRTVPPHPAHAHEEILRAEYAARASGDLPAFTRLLAEDVEWHVPGDNPIAGVYRGIDEVLAYVKARQRLSAGTFRVSMEDVLANDRHGLVVASGNATIGGRHRDWRAHGLYRFRDGRIAGCWVLPEDQRQFDEIWGEGAVGRTAEGKAARCAVPAVARNLVGPEAFDYVDAFDLGAADDRRSAEAWARAMFTPRGLILHAFGVLWGVATGVEKPRTEKRLAYFTVLAPGSESAVLEGDGGRYRIRLVVLAGEGRVTVVTFVKSRGGMWRQALKPIMAAHRRVLPLLMERAVGLR